MKTIGLIGGMSWESTVTYYQHINQTVKGQLGGFHSAKCILYSVDFEEIEDCQKKGDWDQSAQILIGAAKGLERAGADFIAICTNTMHKVVDQIQGNIAIPILHIAEVTGSELIKSNIYKVALLGTKYTMEQDFYKNKLVEKGIEVLIPEPSEMVIINNIIYQELCMGVVSQSSKIKFLEIISQLEKRGACGVILGCTEIGLLVNQEDTVLPLFDTAILHARAVALQAIK